MSVDRCYMTKTCAECPWRRDVEPGQFPPERYEALVSTCREGGIRPMFACHKSPEGQEKACAGFLLVNGLNNNMVRMNVATGKINLKEIEATGPLYDDYRQMATANGFDPGPDWNDQSKP